VPPFDTDGVVFSSAADDGSATTVMYMSRCGQSLPIRLSYSGWRHWRRRAPGPLRQMRGHTRGRSSIGRLTARASTVRPARTRRVLRTTSTACTTTVRRHHRRF
jgi:hypothetical protein